MPLQNRVDPFGALVASTARGAWMGNRGILHDDQRNVVAPWRHKAWVTCQLAYKGRHREVFAPGRYSELFFLDEATALAAGHRPCGECRHARYLEFKELWCAASLPGREAHSVPVAEVDAVLHTERAVRGGGKVMFKARLSDLPDGAFFAYEDRAYLRWGGVLRAWTHHGYEESALRLPGSAQVDVLTPASVVEVLRLGFRPQVHESALA